MTQIYRSVLHDAPEFEMERQIYLLAKAGHAAWSAWMNSEPHLQNKTELEKDPMTSAMGELYAQLDKTDVFMGGLAEGRRRAT